MKKQIHMLPCALALVYMLGVRGGRVALWLEDDPQPVQVFPTAVCTLPPEAQQQLHQGIPAETRDELARLLEAFLS